MARERISIRATKDVLLVNGADLVMYSDAESTQTYAIDGATGAVTVSSDGSGADATWYGATSGTYMQWDSSADSLLIPGTAGKFMLGAFSSSTHGSGSALSATNTAAFRVYTDDGNAAIGSGQFVRSGVFRNLQTYTGGNREQEAAGVVGQVVSVAGTNRHNMCGVMGSYEMKGTITVDGQAASTDTWCQAGVIGRVGMSSGTMTLNTNGVLAGVAAMSNINTAVTQTYTGEYCGFYVGAWANTDDFEIGLLIEDGKTTTGIDIGTCTTGITISTCTTGVSITGATGYAVDIQTSGQFRMGVQGTGIPTATATPFAMEIHSETESALTAGLTGLSCGIRSRYEISVAQPNQISLTAVEGRLRVKAAIADGCHSAVSGTIEGDASIAYTGTSTTQRNAGNFCVELGASSTLSAGWLTGVTIDSSTDDSVSMASVDYAGLRIKTSSGKEVWEYGIHIDDSAATVGIDIGACATGIDFTGAITTSGINFSNATMPVASDNVSLINIGTYDAGLSSAAGTDNTFAVMNNRTSTADDAYWFMNEYMKISMTTADQTSKSFVNLAIRQAIAKPVAATYGIQSHLTFSGTGDVSSEIIALSAQTAGTAHTGSGLHWGVKSDLRATNTPSGAGHQSACFFGVGTVSCSAGLYIEPLGSTTMYSGVYLHAAGNMTNCVEIGGTANTTYLFRFDAADGGCVHTSGSEDVVNTSGVNSDGSLEINLAGTSYYIPIFNASHVS